jgi:hypothetical protein
MDPILFVRNDHYKTFAIAPAAFAEIGCPHTV